MGKEIWSYRVESPDWGGGGGGVVVLITHNQSKVYTCTDMCKIGTHCSTCTCTRTPILRRNANC